MKLNFCRTAYCNSNKFYFADIPFSFRPLGKNGFTSSLDKNIFELALASPSNIIYQNLKQNHFIKSIG